MLQGYICTCMKIIYALLAWNATRTYLLIWWSMDQGLCVKAAAAGGYGKQPTQESHISDTGNEWPSVHPEIKLLAVLNWTELNWTAFVSSGVWGNLRALMAYWSWAGASWVSLQSWILRPAAAAQHNPGFNELACHMAKILHFPILWWEEFIGVVDIWEWIAASS